MNDTMSIYYQSKQNKWLQKSKNEYSLSIFDSIKSIVFSYTN